MSPCSWIHSGKEGGQRCGEIGSEEPNSQKPLRHLLEFGLSLRINMELVKDLRKQKRKIRAVFYKDHTQRTQRTGGI